MKNTKRRLSGDMGTAEVGRLLDLSGARVGQLIRGGLLVARRIGPAGRWRVSRASVERLLSSGGRHA